MQTLFIVAAGSVFFWFILGVVSKLPYASKVERQLRADQKDPNEIERIVGKTRYTNALFFLKRQGTSPENAASLLALYVLRDMGSYSSAEDPEERQLLQILGYIK